MSAVDANNKTLGLKNHIDNLYTVLCAQLDTCKCHGFVCRSCPAFKDGKCMFRETAEKIFNALYGDDD